MKIIITESQHNTLKKHFINENDVYDLTPEEMEQVKESARKDALHQLQNLKNRVSELTKFVENFQNIDFSKLPPNVAELAKERLDVLYKENLRDLKHFKKQLEDFNLEDTIEKMVDWDLKSAGGLSYGFRYEKYRKEALNRKFTKEDIINLFVTSLEGGSNYWYYMELPDSINSYGDSTSEAVGNFILKGGTVPFYDVEMISDIEYRKKEGEYNIQGDIVNQKELDKDYEEALLGYVDMDSILEGINIIKKDYPEVWENILLEQEDASDADVFLQLCVMGEVVFG
jgi:hypothetical protein